MTDTMKALMKRSPGPGLEFTEVPVPTPGPGEVLIQVHAATICGSDLHLYKWNAWAAERIRPPLILGHEICGRIVARGRDVRFPPEDAYVAVESHIFCGHCRACRTGNAHVCYNLKILGIDRNGGYAQYVLIPAQNAIPVDESLHPAVVSMQEPFGNAVDTVLAEPVVGKTVLITGCGPIGLMAIAVARACGADRIFATEPNAFRRDLARKMGADVVLDPLHEPVVEYLRDETRGHGVDVVLEMSGHPDAIRTGFEVLAMAGRISLLGLPGKPVEINLTDDIIFKSARVYGITGRHLYETWYRVQTLLGKAGVDLLPLLTHTFPLAEFQTAMELLLNGRAAKIALLPDPELVQSRLNP